jgi:phosphoribosylformylglycinamidine synthase
MKVVVNISLKEGVLDPEGQAIKTSLSNLGFKNFSDVRTGKQIILNFEKIDENEAILATKKMCEDLLVNTVIETYKINVLKDKKN